ncbi:hypothetical protein JVX92_07560 [Microbacterium hominis]|uniref:hypothetical protein n=1 Tax=Microbacterium hominis TaxID=162426 RepID=UPI00196405DA|nr:hypothetical protein [Microbacterium hominis]QRY39421.1 hypothetical protein JVX92_07560 [Microbacterium hominis]
MSDGQDDEIFAIDGELLAKEAREISARIISNDSPVDELKRILAQTDSVPYTRMVAEEAATLCVRMLLDADKFVIALVPVVSGRLSDFLHKARFAFALHGFNPGTESE